MEDFFNGKIRGVLTIKDIKNKHPANETGIHFNNIYLLICIIPYLVP